MKFGKFEIDEWVLIFAMIVILIAGACYVGYKLDSKDKEIEKLKVERDLEITRAALKDGKEVKIETTKINK